MAELIDKGALYDAMTEEYKKHYAGTGKGYDFTIAMQMVQNQPTVTEAEIKAKAIDEFAEKLCDAFSEKYGEVTVNGIKFDVLTLDGATEITWDVAEQLRGV